MFDSLVSCYLFYTTVSDSRHMSSLFLVLSCTKMETKDKSGRGKWGRKVSKAVFSDQPFPHRWLEKVGVGGGCREQTVKKGIIDLMLLLLLEFGISIVLSRPKTTMGNYGWPSCSHAKARRWRDQMLGASVPEVYMSGRFFNSHLRHFWINRSNKPRRSPPLLK